MADKAKMLKAFAEGGKYKDTAAANPKAKAKPVAEKKPVYVGKKGQK